MALGRGKQRFTRPSPPNPGRLIIDFQKRQNPRKLPAVAQNLVSMEIGEEGGGGKGEGGRTGARCRTPGRKSYRWDNVKRTFCAFCCKSLLVFPQDHLHASPLHSEKKQKAPDGTELSPEGDRLVAAAWDEDVPEGVTRPKDAPIPPARRNPNATTFTPCFPLRQPQICSLSTFGGRNQHFWLPPFRPRWGAAGGEGSGRAAPGPRSHDLSDPARCYIYVNIFLFNPTAAKSTNRA